MSPAGGFYAVKAGHVPGVYTTWEECERQVKGFASAKFKKFTNEQDALVFLNVNPDSDAASLSVNQTTPSSMEEDVWLEVYTDGACKGNGLIAAVAGIGVWWGPEDERNMAERCPGYPTNNRAELIAIIRALETIPPSHTPVKIFTDSQYSMKCVTEWIPMWRRNNFIRRSGEAVKNLWEVRYLSALINERKKNGQDVKFVKVKGHSGDPGNEAADNLANHAVSLPAEADRDWEALTIALESGSDRAGESTSRLERARKRSAETANLPSSAPPPPQSSTKKKKTLAPVEPTPASPELTRAFKAGALAAEGKLRINASAKPPPETKFGDFVCQPTRSPQIISNEEQELYADCLLDDEKLLEEFLQSEFNA